VGAAIDTPGRGYGDETSGGTWQASLGLASLALPRKNGGDGFGSSAPGVLEEAGARRLTQARFLRVGGGWGGGRGPRGRPTEARAPQACLGTASASGQTNGPAVFAVAESAGLWSFASWADKTRAARRRCGCPLTNQGRLGSWRHPAFVLHCATPTAHRRRADRPGPPGYFAVGARPMRHDG